MDTPNLTQKVILVTGAARRIGAEIVRTLHQQGANVLVHYHESGESAEQLCLELNAERTGSAATLQADLMKSEAFPEFAKCALAIWGRLDGLVNNASNFFPTPLADVSIADWDSLMGVNLKAPYFLSLAFANSLTESKGCIINISDHHLSRPFRDHSVYCIAKSAQQMLTKSLAKELAPAVRVNAVAPGIVLWPEKEMRAQDKEKITREIALQRTGEPSDVANAVAFFLESSYLTGQILTVDGGRSLQW